MANNRNIVQLTGQSKPVDVTEPYDPAWVGGKTILITGGASGFGEGFFRKWAANGAIVIIGDINDARGKALVEEVRTATGNQHLHYLHCNVTEWQSQVDFFHSAVQLSPNNAIDAVVANAGIIDTGTPFQLPENLDAEAPPKPNFSCYDVNLLGVMYTSHLAFFYLPRNPRYKNSSPNASGLPSSNTPDRHLLLIGSVASLCPISGLVQYGIAKHGVLGMFRSLRSTSMNQGVRVNMLCPYFIDTPLIAAPGRVLLAGAAIGRPEDVVDAGTRLMADPRIVGRALVVGPKVRLDDDGQLLPEDSKDGKQVSIWEPYAHDFEEVDAFTQRFVQLLNAVEKTRGWVGWASDILGAFAYPLRNLWRERP
ncbi:short chain dehydrogenase/reductase-like protein [Bisporella sp. PMI_857]|nr:short chain dehydrogenase/reductase-like protein [Bisporella sp. PMI_857]